MIQLMHGKIEKNGDITRRRLMQPIFISYKHQTHNNPPKFAC